MREAKGWNKAIIILALSSPKYSLSGIKENIIIEKDIGRIRDIKIHPINGKIYLLAQDKLWLFEKNNS